MKELGLVLVLTIVILLICFALIGVKILLKKNGEFKRQCASIDPYTGERTNCFCGHSNVLTSKCENKKHSVLEVDMDLLRDALK
ncbi:MAG: membrane or secreted protein [Bacteroidota bacterium]|nr:membrane or secreted protein [Bacteroidota bacterium]